METFIRLEHISLFVHEEEITVVEFLLRQISSYPSFRSSILQVCQFVGHQYLEYKERRHIHQPFYAEPSHTSFLVLLDD